MRTSNITRRQFGLSVAATVAAPGLARADAASGSVNQRQGLPREVWVASMCQVGLKAETPSEMCEKMISRMEETIPYQPDIVCTPEVFAFAGLRGGKPPLSESAEERSGPVLNQFAAYARRHRCYVICSTYTKEAGHYYIASVLLDRDGQYVGEYRKINPTDEELELGVTPGPLVQRVFETDFGTIGIQICYDVNWYDNWRRLSEAGAKLVFWPSAFGGGMMLNSLAWMNKYFIVSSTALHPTKIVNPLGNDIVATGRAASWVCAPLNLDFAVVQIVKDFAKFRDITKKYGRGFRFQILNVEALATIEGVSASVSTSEVLKEFDIPTSQQMFAVSTRLQNAKRRT